jgi:magnesium transporter
MARHMTPTLQEIRQQVLDLLSTHNQEALRTYLKEQHPADIADVLEMLDDQPRLVIFNLLQAAAAADVLDETRTEVTRDLVDAVPDEKIADLLEVMPEDDAAEILSELDKGRAKDLLGLMEPHEAVGVETLLAYPEDTAGRLMTTRVVRLDASWTVDQALEHLRRIDPETETRTYLYVVNGNDQLIGVLPIWKLLTAPPARKIADLMDPSVISVRVDTDQEEVARIVAQYDFLAVPVVDRDGHFVGIVTHDDVIDIIQDEFTEDVQRFGGSAPLEQAYLSTSPLTVVWKRVGWLLVLFLTEMMTGTVLRFYEAQLSELVALSFFIPLLIGTGGNAGSQTTSTIIRALAIGEVRFKDTWRLLWHELRAGVLLGAVMGAVGLVRALTWGSQISLAATVGIALFTVVVWANVIGSLLPPLADHLHIDPTVISGPVMSTLVDATGLVIYFTLAKLIIGL